MKKIIFVSVISALASLFLFRKKIMLMFFSPTKTEITQGIKVENLTQEKNPTNKKKKQDIEIIAQNLNIPWDLVQLPDESLLVTERPGNLLHITQNGEKKIVQKIEGVEHIGEGGLLGITLHPNYDQNNFIYLYLTSKNGDELTNRVERYKFDGKKLSNKTLVLDGIKGAKYHDGGKIDFGPDGFLYITTGDAGDKDSAQDKNQLSGKILRITDRGYQANGNPFSNSVYSLGHRNPQGITWDDRGQLWSSEHGPSGLETGFDELNLITKGSNYGWPLIKGEQEIENMTSPIIQSGSNDTWAPGGIAYWNHSLFFSGLRGESLYEAKIKDNNTVVMKAHFRKEFGRIRAVKMLDDGYLYITTSNRDGRGEINKGDDKIIKINPEVFR